MRMGLALLIPGLCMLIVPAMSQPVTLEAAFGNTVVVTDSEGFETDIFIEKDGSFSGRLPDGSEFQGSWRVSGTDVCFTETAPKARSPACFPANAGVAHKVWHGKNGEGADVTISILPGRPK